MRLPCNVKLHPWQHNCESNYLAIFRITWNSIQMLRPVLPSPLIPHPGVKKIPISVGLGLMQFPEGAWKRVQEVRVGPDSLQPRKS